MTPRADAFLGINIGDHEKHYLHSAAYVYTCSLLTTYAAIYGLPSTPEDLSDEQREILADLNKSEETLVYAQPTPLLVGQLLFALDPSPGLAKTTDNFKALCRGDKGMSKNAPNKPLHYSGCSLHRIVKGFIAQGGDITRGDGSGGESIYGGKFNDEKEGLKKTVRRGSLAMANSGKNSNTSQFFIVLSDDEVKLKKLKGKYVVFGELVAGFNVLDRLEAIGTEEGKPAESVWIGDCGVL